MANAEPPPVVIAEGVGHVTRYFLREVGSVFWLIVNTFEETFERIQHGRVPFRAASFFATPNAPVSIRCRSWDWFHFSWPDDGAVDRLPVATFRNGAADSGLVRLLLHASLGPCSLASCSQRASARRFTAELGTMQVSEEVEAIEAMGIGPLRFLVAPRMLALVLLMPCLSRFRTSRPYSPAAWSAKPISVLPFPYFFDLVKDSLLIRDIITGILKSFLFGLLIAAIACYRGTDSERRRRWSGHFDDVQCCLLQSLQ
jgi:phospholipid/cholesterol/gamma-HCH transport system permease protein